MKKKFEWLNHVSNFLAVIIGVMLAFYINERARLNSDKKEAQILMQSLAEEMVSHIRTFEEYQIPINKEIQQNVDSLVGKLIMKDYAGVEEMLGTILQVENNFPSSSTYTSMKASGKLALIEDVKLRSKLSYFYDELALESQAKGELQADFFTDELLIWLADNADLSTGEVFDTQDLTILANRLIIYQSLLSQKITNYEYVLEESRELHEYLSRVLGNQEQSD